MEASLFSLMCDIEDFLIDVIDSDPDYGNYLTADDFFDAQDPEINSLYQCFKTLADKFIGEEK